MEITYKTIGIIHSVLKEVGGIPIQPSGTAGIKETIKVYKQCTVWLCDKP